MGFRLKKLFKSPKKFLTAPMKFGDIARARLMRRGRAMPDYVPPEGSGPELAPPQEQPPNQVPGATPPFWGGYPPQGVPSVVPSPDAPSPEIPTGWADSYGLSPAPEDAPIPVPPASSAPATPDESYLLDDGALSGSSLESLWDYITRNNNGDPNAFGRTISTISDGIAKLKQAVAEFVAKRRLAVAAEADVRKQIVTAARILAKAGISPQARAAAAAAKLTAEKLLARYKSDVKPGFDRATAEINKVRATYGVQELGFEPITLTIIAAAVVIIMVYGIKKASDFSTAVAKNRQQLNAVSAGTLSAQDYAAIDKEANAAQGGGVAGDIGRTVLYVAGAALGFYAIKEFVLPSLKKRGTI